MHLNLLSGREHFGNPFGDLFAGLVRDQAFQFYYPENLEALTREGAKVIEISPLQDAALPDVDALYIGGGFPETAAQGLADNESFRQSLRRAVDNGPEPHDTPACLH